MNDPTPISPKPFFDPDDAESQSRLYVWHQVLHDELKYLGKSVDEPTANTPSDALRQIYAQMGSADAPTTAALCFSGGGIRSATFNLGVLQALAKAGLLGSFDYLSSVSGGGYIAGWLQAWLHRTDRSEVFDALARRDKPANPIEPEPKPLDHLREYSNYLTPKVGLFSTDTWASIALVVRNLLLNWLVLLPVFTVFLAVPQLALLAAKLPSWPAAANFAAALAIVLGVWAGAAIHTLRRRRTVLPHHILIRGVVPLWCSTLSLSMAWLWLDQLPQPMMLFIFSVVWCIGVPLAGWLLSLSRRTPDDASPPLHFDLIGLLGSGAMTVPVFFLATSWLFEPLHSYPPVFVILAVPTLLGIYLLARVFYVALSSLGERKVTAPAKRENESGNPQDWSIEQSYADREWWARLSAWILIGTLGWLALASIGVFALSLFNTAIGSISSVASLIFGYIAARIGASAATPAATGNPAGATKSAWFLPVFCSAAVIAILMMLATLNARIAMAVFGNVHMFDIVGGRRTGTGWSIADAMLLLMFFCIPIAAAIAAWLLGWVVNVNRFSAHGLYRNRLVRAYLGASDNTRSTHVNAFSGFSPNDNLSMHMLAQRLPSADAWPKPLHVIGVALNLVSSAEHLAWQQRKAESFSITPLYCGNHHDGYRRSRRYGGADGISLGTAITISGAAANPSAGYHSSALTAFLMTLFNVRLGCWLGNTKEAGKAVFRKSGPAHAWKPLFADLLGLTDSSHPYINLSDGGHFENLGVYEMVLRRCRYIVACDVGQDPPHDFEDLGNLIRKVRVDFGIRIEFEERIQILPRKRKTFGSDGLVAALGTVHYDDVDPGATKGRLLYIKPTLRADGRSPPYDVFSYSRANAQFPHQPTADQWFDESQFESYRALGEHLVGALMENHPESTLDDLFASVQKAIKEKAGVQASSR